VKQGIAPNDRAVLPLNKSSHQVGTLFAFDLISSLNAKGAQDVTILKSI
jgi:hypothetical protein